MAIQQLLVLLLGLLGAIATPQPFTRNTIFGDERLKGEIFEDIDSFSDISLFNDEDNPYRLPDDTIPIHYDILWIIDVGRRTYAGTVDIDIVATRTGVSEIVLHSDHTEILSNGVTLRLKNTNEIIQTTFNLQSEYHFLRIQSNVNLNYDATNPVVYTLSISFTAEMRNDMYGIYGSWFRNTHNQSDVSWMATTQFQATAGRYAFPCYDEPKFKATFTITIRRPQTHRSWSCMRLARTDPVELAGYEDDVYYQTPIMSTYLLAIIVAEYDSLTPSNQNTLLYEVIGRPGALNDNQGVYALEVGQELLRTMSEHTGIDFYSIDPNIKMTQAAIPDFGAGAMENFGLLTYREAYLMYDEVHTNGYFKQMIAYILSHEIAHMWFGNLVTNDWWDVLWLNEGFARYYQYFLTHWVEDYMGLETRFITEQVHASLLSDSANNPQPLSNPGVGSPASVSAMFSTISYNKGAAVIRMTEHLMGFEVHRMGLRSYLTNKAYGTAVPSDLFNELEAAGVSANAFSQYGSNFDFSEYYKSWTEQPGHPVLNVHVNHGTGDMTITQRRFNINTGYSSINSHYVVPITFSSASNPDFNDTKPSHVLRDTVTVINRGSVGDEWVIFNKQQTGFYRVNYDDYTWDLITLALKSSARTTIHEYNRAQIVNDVFQFARSGLMSYRRAFNILSFLENETSYAPWVAAVTGFNWIRNRLQGTTQLAQLENMISGWATTVMNEIGYSEPANEDFMRSYLRYQLAPFMCNLNVAACRTAALNQFRALVDTGVEVPADSRNWVYCNGLRQGSEADFNFMWNRFLQHNVYNEKILLLQVLGCTPHVTSLNTFLNNIVEENYVIRPQDYTTAWNTAVSGNEANTQIVFSFIQNNLATVINAFGNAATPLSYVSSRLRTEADIVAFQTWADLSQTALGNSYQAVYNGAETSRESIRWAGAVATDINDYIVNGNDDLTTTTSTAPPTAATSTTARPQLVEPETPDIPDSASMSFISLFLISMAVLANRML